MNIKWIMKYISNEFNKKVYLQKKKCWYTNSSATCLVFIFFRPVLLIKELKKKRKRNFEIKPYHFSVFAKSIFMWKTCRWTERKYWVLKNGDVKYAIFVLFICPIEIDLSTS